MSTAPTGYTGHGDQVFVVNNQLNNYTIHAVLTNDAGHQIVITQVFILDLSTNGQYGMCALTCQVELAG